MTGQLSIRFPIVLLASVLLVSTGFCQVERPAGEYALRSSGCDLIVERNGAVKTMCDGGQSATRASLVSLCNGKSHDSEISLKPVSPVTRKGDGLVCSYADESGNLKVSERLSNRNGNIFCNLGIRNLGKTQVWLKVGVNLPLFYQDGTVSYWDGATLKESFSGQSSSSSLYSTFPAAAVYNRKNGVAVGIAADQLFSHIENTLAYGDSKTLSYFVKSVIDSGGESGITFIIYGFTPEYGFLNAIDSYYNEYARFFQPTKGIDTNALYTAHAGAFHGQEGSDNEYGEEAIRRSFGQIYWWYAPFKKAGDFWGTEDEYKIKLAHEDLVAERFTGTAADQQARLKGEFRNAVMHGVAPMHYIINWCEEDLANRKYPDNIIRYGDGTSTSTYPWVQTWTGDVCMWWGGKFGADTKAALRKIVDNYDISGFAVDCAEGNGTRPARGYNGIQNSPGRAYDDEGLYCDEGIAIAQMIDYIHTLKKGDKVMTAWPNFSYPSPYFTAFRVDGALCEPDFQTVLRDIDVHQKIRYLMGSKPRQLLLSTERESLGKSVDSNSMSPEQIRNLYRNLWDTGLLMCFRLAYYPNPEMLYGYPRIMKSMPVLFAAIKEGWQPVPAITLDTDLWTARYGKDLGCYIFIGNQKTSSKTVSAYVSNGYIGKGSYLFSTFDGRELDNDIHDGKTHLAFALDAKKYIMLKAMARIEGASDIKARVKETTDSVSGTIQITANGTDARQVRMGIRIPAETTAVSVKVNGRPVRFHTGSGEVVFTTGLSGATVMEIQWKSRLFLSSAGEIRDYPFISVDQEPNCTIVIPENADEWDIAAADRVSEYFRFWYSEVEGKTVRIPVKKVSEVTASDVHQVRILSDGYAKQSGVRVSGANLCISASNSKRRYALVFKLMGLLDEKYPYYGTISGKARDEDTIEMRQKAGLNPGGVLD